MTPAEDEIPLLGWPSEGQPAPDVPAPEPLDVSPERIDMPLPEWSTTTRDVPAAKPLDAPPRRIDVPLPEWSTTTRDVPAAEPLDAPPERIDVPLPEWPLREPDAPASDRPEPGRVDASVPRSEVADDRDDAMRRLVELMDRIDRRLEAIVRILAEVI